MARPTESDPVVVGDRAEVTPHRLQVLQRYARMIRSHRYVELLRARWTLLGALGVSGVGIFLKLTRELSEGELDAFDKAVLGNVIALRVPSLNGSAVDLTALGSVTVLTMIVVIAVLFFWAARDFAGILQLSIAAIGGAIGSTLLKDAMERARPPEVTRLVHVVSSSYPSGHSLASASIYLSIALVLSHRMHKTGERVLLFSLALLLPALIGFSRAYLGVHYPSDIAAGLSLGGGWALLVSSAFSYARARGVCTEPSK